jgi:hypothetical protein
MRLLRLTAVGAALALGVAAPTVAAGASSQTLVFSVRFATQSRNVQQVGVGGTVAYGQLRFLGTTTINNQPVVAEFQSSVHYTKGSGPFTAWLTLTRPDGSKLGADISGRTKARPDTTDAAFRGTLVVVGGTGSYLNAHGSGSFTGSRKAALGGTVDITFRIQLRT